jgi:hypothetical protein
MEKMERRTGRKERRDGREEGEEGGAGALTTATGGGLLQVAPPPASFRSETALSRLGKGMSLSSGEEAARPTASRFRGNREVSPSELASDKKRFG